MSIQSEVGGPLATSKKKSGVRKKWPYIDSQKSLSRLSVLQVRSPQENSRGMLNIGPKGKEGLSGSIEKEKVSDKTPKNHTNTKKKKKREIRKQGGDEEPGKRIIRSISNASDERSHSTHQTERNSSQKKS